MANKKKSIAVLGIGRFGSSVAENLFKQGHDVLVVDKNEEWIENILPKVTHGVVGDVTDEKVLKSLGIRNIDIAVVAIGGDLQSSILVTILLKELGVKYVLAKAQGELHSKVLQKIGADRVILPEKDMGFRVAQSLGSKNLIDFIEISNNYSIVEIKVPEKWIGKSIKELNVRVKYKVTIIAINRENKTNISPNAEYVIQENDILAIIGTNKDISKISNIK